MQARAFGDAKLPPRQFSILREHLKEASAS
jgi:hypothetical protein